MNTASSVAEKPSEKTTKFVTSSASNRRRMGTDFSRRPEGLRPGQASRLAQSECRDEGDRTVCVLIQIAGVIETYFLFFRGRDMVDFDVENLTSRGRRIALEM